MSYLYAQAALESHHAQLRFQNQLGWFGCPGNIVEVTLPPPAVYIEFPAVLVPIPKPIQKQTQIPTWTSSYISSSVSQSSSKKSKKSKSKSDSVPKFMGTPGPALIPVRFPDGTTKMLPR